jgi:hypothetical protein
VDHRGRTLEAACALLDGHQVPESLAPGGRVIELPGLGHPLLPPWTITATGADGVSMQGHFTRSHVGGNNAVHGGMIPLLYDWLFGMVVSTAGTPPPTLMARADAESHGASPASAILRLLGSTN